MDKIKNLKEKVYKVLEVSERARNDDIHLQFHLIHTFYPSWIMKTEDWQWWISRKASSIFKEDWIRRLRAKIQNEEKLFLPTDPEVRKQRKISEENWHYSMKNDVQWKRI